MVARIMLGLAGILMGLALLLGGADERVLAIPYRSQLDGSPYAQANCGPAALGMALAYYGIDASLWDLRVRAMMAQHSWVDDDGGYSDRYGVFVYNLATVAESFGLRANGLWQREANRVDRLREWQAIDLRRQIDAGRPVIVQTRYQLLPGRRASAATEDHYIVVHGVTGDGFVYSDPINGPDERIAEAELLDAMAGASSPRVGFAVVKSAH
jgi:Peptidase_C39 like family